jgi:hypothetical protein
MNIQKLAIIVAAIAINVAVLAWFHASSAAAIARAARAPAPAAPTWVLPAVNVTPGPAALRAAQRPQPAAADRAAAARTHRG